MPSLLPSFDSQIPSHSANDYLSPNHSLVPTLSQETQAPESRIRKQLDEFSGARSAENCRSVPTVAVWGIDFAQFDMEQTLDHLRWMVENGGKGQVITANLHYVMLHDASEDIRSLTSRAAVVLCDGMPILWRSRLKSSSLPERVAGSDLIDRLCEQAACLGHRVFFLGAAEGVAERTAAVFQSRYPGLQVAGFECPPFRPLTAEEESGLVERIRKAKTDILLVAFGQPKGEQWIDRNFHRLEAPVCIQLGASFDFIAGTAKRAPRFFQISGLEWLYRACSDPKRLVPRYASNFLFLLKRLRQDILDATQG